MPNGTRISMVTEFLIHVIMHSFTLQFDLNLNHITDMLAAATTEVKPLSMRQTTDNCYYWRNKYSSMIVTQWLPELSNFNFEKNYYCHHRLVI